MARRHQQPEAEDAGRLQFKSLSLGTVFDRLEQPGKHLILDLGPPVGANIEYFAKFSCKVYVEDVYRTLNGDAPPDGDEAGQLYDRLFDYDDDTRFDIILGWDLFNYLDFDTARETVTRLSRFSRPGAIVFLLVSTHKVIPSEPCRYMVADSKHLIWEPTCIDTRPCPRHTPLAITKMMAGFEVQRSFLLRNGLQEYLFVFR